MPKSPKRRLEEVVLPRINAFLAERGVWLSTEKTVITPICEGFDFLGQTLRKHERCNGKPAKLRITPSKASFHPQPSPRAAGRIIIAM